MATNPGLVNLLKSHRLVYAGQEVQENSVIYRIAMSYFFSSQISDFVQKYLICKEWE